MKRKQNDFISPILIMNQKKNMSQFQQKSRVNSMESQQSTQLTRLFLQLINSDKMGNFEQILQLLEEILTNYQISDFQVLNPAQQLIPFFQIVNKNAVLSLEYNFDKWFELLSQSQSILLSLDHDNPGFYDSLKFALFNNLAIFFIQENNEKEAIKYLKICQSLVTYSTKKFLLGILYNNIASIQLKHQSYYKAYKASEQGIMELEKRIFDYLRLRPKQVSQQFSSELVVLLNGYYLIGLSLRQLHHQSSELDNQKLQEISNKNSKQFFENGYKLANKYLGNSHYFTKLFFDLKQEEFDDFLQNLTSDDNNNNNNDNTNANNNYDVEKYLIEPKRKLNFNRDNLSHYHFRRSQQQKQFDDLNYSAQGLREQKDFRINSPKQFEFMRQQQQQQQYQSQQQSENNSLQFEQSQQIQSLVSQVKLLENSMNFMQSQLVLQKEKEQQSQQQQKQQSQENSQKNIQTPKCLQSQQQKEQNQMEQMIKEMQKKLDNLEEKNKTLLESQSRQKEQFFQYEKKINSINNQLSEKEKIINQQQEQQKEIQNAMRQQQLEFQQQQQQQQQLLLQQQKQQQNLQQQQQQQQQQQLATSQTQNQQRVKQPPGQNTDKQQMQIPSPREVSNGNFSQLEDEEGDYFEEASLNQQEIFNQKNFFNLKDFLLLPKEVICQQRVCYDNVFYKLACKLFVDEKKNTNNINTNNQNNNSNNRKLQIQVNSTNQQQQFFQIINEEMGRCCYQDILELEIISNIVKLINYQDILPIEISLKTITSFPQFCRYCIMPFLALKPNENKLEIWPKAIGLCPPIDRLFMKEEVFVQFHHIQNQTFRIILSEKKNGFSFFVDICLEDTSLKGLLFPIDVKYRKDSFIHDLGEQTDAFDSLQKFTSLYQDYKLPNEYNYDSYKILNTTLLEDNLNKVIDELDEFFTIVKGYSSLAEFLSEKHFKVIRVKVWREFNRFRIYFIRERIDKQSFEVNLRNSFLTFAIQNEKVKAFGSTEYPFQRIWQQFGIQYSKMDNDDKKLICTLISELYSLNVHEKKLDDDEYDRYEQNPILPVQLESGGYSRTYIGETYQFPITITTLGINEILIGVRMTLFDIETREENGMFFSVNQEFWERVKKDEAPKKKRKYQIMNPIDEKYYIVQAVKKYGWKLLMNFATFQNSTNKSSIEGRKLGNGYTVVEQIENVFEGSNIQNLHNQ